jgi:colanic acid biosynthesis glycosyl transferase WcaI
MRWRIVRKGLEAGRVGVFPNWADVDAIRPLPRDNALRRALGLSERDVFVQYSGNMGQKQGLEILLDAAHRLTAESNVVFGLFGEGAHRAALEARSRAEGLRNVLFHDLVPWSDVPELLAAGDIHVVPQKREAADLLMPSKVANIMAAGRPVVATCDRGTALCAVLEASGGGKTVTPGDADELAAAIRLLARDDTVRLEMGARNRRYAEEHLAKEAVLGDFERQLRQMVDPAFTVP